jgi:D-serine deaminase-like pyridoxal phosphate-dependent protein
VPKTSTIQDAWYLLLFFFFRYPARGEFLIDAGGCALHKDPAGIRDGSWGCLLDDPSLVLRRMTQEVSVVGRRAGAAGNIDLTRYAPGTVVRIVPNHSCMTAACHEVYHVVEGAPCAADGARTVVGQWTPCKFW